MTLNPANLKYASTHMWIEVVADGAAKIGITDHAQQKIGDILFIELPETKHRLAKGQKCAVIESLKSDSNIYCPLDGEVIDINDVLDENPEMINIDPYGDGWIFTLKPGKDCDFGVFLDATSYTKLTKK